VSYSNDSGSQRHIPANFRLQYSQEQILSRVKELGAEIDEWCKSVWRESRTDVVAIPVLRGGVYFFADLSRHIGSSIEIAPVKTSAYDAGTNAAKEVTVDQFADPVQIKGRVVLVVEDVCDSGRTLEQLERSLLERGAREVRTVVLVRRLLPRPTFVPCWVGLEYSGPEWFVGYGMDDNERYRNLPDVYVIGRNDQ
jgi:hypoxanthine phosphoribosyltransferase